MCPFAFCSKIATYFEWAHCFGHCDFCQLGTLSFLMGTAVFQMGTHVFQMGTHVFQMGTQSSLADPTFIPETGTRLSLMGTTSPQIGATFCPSGHTCFPKRGTSFLPSGHHWAHGHKPSQKHVLRYKTDLWPMGHLTPLAH